MPISSGMQRAALCAAGMVFVSAARYGATAETLKNLDTITVVGTRSASSLASTPRIVTVFNLGDSDRTAGVSIADILETSAAVDVRERGSGGIQADISMRGGSFEQSLVLIDGIPMSDPQTGHHMMNVPLSADDIERIEVLAGQGSRMYGPGAIGGVINIVTRSPHRTQIRLSTETGQDATLGARASLSMYTGPMSHLVSAGRHLSDGYRYNTDSDMSTLWYRGAATIRATRLNTLIGYTDKDFGANGFYSAFYPNQREHTSTLLGAVSAVSSIGSFTLKPRFSWRRHRDDFVLDYENPQMYRNQTLTDVVAGALQASFAWKAGTLSFSADGALDHIESDDLGSHERYRGGLYLEHVFVLFDRITFVPGAVAYYTTGPGWKVWPGADLGVRITDWLRAHGSVDYSFRVPTFTELYTNSPANMGSPDLEPEELLSFEGGLRFTPGPVRGTLSVFRRNGQGVIDWARNQSNRQWLAVNIDSVQTTGIESALSVTLAGRISRQPLTLSAGYTGIDMRRVADKARSVYAEQVMAAGTEADTVSLIWKYGTDYLKHKLSIGIDHALLYSLRVNWQMRYEQRNGSSDGAVLLDSRLYANLSRVSLYVQARNLFDVAYNDFESVPGPGRWFGAGVGLTLTRAEEPGQRTRRRRSQEERRPQTP